MMVEEQAQPQTYLVIYEPGPAWLSGQPVAQQPLKEHGRFLLGLYARGVLKFAGPFLGDAGGAAVISVHDTAEADALMATDPAVVSHVFVYELHPWELVPWDRHLEAHKRD